MNSDKYYLKLHPDDNVLVLIRSVTAGMPLVIDGKSFVFAEDLALGHKIANCDIAAGEKILKYGMPIGSACRNIAKGELVHLHNMQSDYLSTYTLDRANQYEG